MIIINTVSEKYFSLNGINFAKIYQPLKQGSENIGIYNINDTRQQIVQSTRFSDFQINGEVYSSQAEVIEKLLEVIHLHNATVNDYIFNTVENITNNTVNGDVTNLPDEKDLTESSGVLKFRDKNYDFEGFGYRFIPVDFDFENIPSGYDNSIWIIRFKHLLTGGNIVIPSNVVLSFKGGVIKGYSNIEGNGTRIDSVDYDCLGFSGSVSGSWNVERCYPEWFGAVLDGVSDDLNALNKAAAFCYETDIELFLNGDKSVYSSSNIDLYRCRKVNFEGSVVLDSNNSVVLGYRAAVAAFVCDFNLNRVSGGKVIFKGLKNAFVKVGYADEVELYANGDDSLIYSMAYSTFYFGYVVKLNIHSELGAAAAGWINENKFFIGRMTELVMNGNYTHNHNKFYDATFENGDIDIIRGSSNIFYNCRFEGGCDIDFGVGTRNNLLIRTWENTQKDMLVNQNENFVDLGFNNRVVYLHDLAFDYLEVFELNKLSKNYSLSALKRVQNGLEVVASWQDVFNTEIFEVNNDMSIFFETDSALFRYYVYGYDENDSVVLTDEEFVDGIGFSFDVTTGAYRTTTNLSNRSLVIKKGSIVKKVKIRCIVGGNTAGNEFSFLKCVIKKAKNEFLNILKKEKLKSNSKPVSTNYDVGDVVYNETPSSSGYLGWVYLGSGTWKGFGLIES